MLKEKQVDGFIISSTLVDNSEIVRLKNEKYPFVLVDRYFPEIPDTNYVVIDNYKAAFKAVKYLTEIGHKNIAMLSISPPHLTSVKDRNRGYLDALRKAGINDDHYLHCQIPFESIEHGTEWALRQLLNYEKKVTAVLTVNHNIAVAAMKALRKFNVSIPDEISLITFDDLSFFELTDPPITCISQPLDQICKNAVKILMSEINPEKVAKDKTQLVFPSNLIIRNSCKVLCNPEKEVILD